MDDFNMNNKTPLNSSDQNNEQPAAETRNTAPQNEQPMQQQQAEQPAQAPQNKQPAQTPQSEQPMQQPQAEQPAQAPQSEQPQAEEPRTPFQTPVQHPEFRQAQQQTGFGEVPPMSQKPHTPKNKKAQQRLSARSVRRSSRVPAVCRRRSCRQYGVRRQCKQRFGHFGINLGFRADAADQQQAGV